MTTIKSLLNITEFVLVFFGYTVPQVVGGIYIFFQGWGEILGYFHQLDYTAALFLKVQAEPEIFYFKKIPE